MGKVIVIFLYLMLNSQFGFSESAKLKNLMNIRGVRDNELHGFGLVFGLAHTGDSPAFAPTKEAMVNAFKRMGIKAQATDLVPGNIAAVLVTATLPPFARIGDQMDVRISATGDATSLAGGTLLLTPLRAADNEVYAVAQGSVTVGQASGKGASVLTVAHLSKAGTVEREFAPHFIENDLLSLSLKQADFTNNSRAVKAINTRFNGFYARSIDPRQIEVSVPEYYHANLVDFVAEIEAIEIEVDSKAVVVVNERTGTVVMGKDVRVLPVTVAHGQLSISIGGQQSSGSKAEGGALVEIKGASVGDVVQSLNRMNAKPEDLVGILQAIYRAGAMQGDLQFI